MRSFFVFITLSISLNSFAASFNAVGTSGETTQVIRPLREIATCLDKSAEARSLEKCVRPYFAKELPNPDRKSLLRWMVLPWEFQNFGPCPKDDLKKIKKTKKDFYYCSDYKGTTVNRRAMFQMRKSQGKWLLYNIKP